MDYQASPLLLILSVFASNCESRNYKPKKIVLLWTTSEKILRNIYKNLPAGVELYDKDGYLVDINDKRVLEIFGLSDKNEALGVNLFDNPNIPLEVKERLRAKRRCKLLHQL